MQFIAGVEIQPSAQFGVPQDDTIVVPAGTNITSAAIHTSSGTRFGHGTLSRFRDENEAIRKTLKILGLDCRLQDNFIHITLEAERGREAYDRIVDALDRFTKHLILSMGLLFSYKVLFVESESVGLYNLPRLITMISGTNYDLEHVSSKIDEAEKMSALEDPVLDRALQYYRIDEKRLAEIERNYGLVKEVAERIIRDYRQYLSVGKPSFAAKESSIKEGMR